MSTKLWYDRYKEGWLNALPLGNGKLAAMFFGDPQREHIQVNEESLYTGRQLEEACTPSPEMLDKIRQLIFEGDFEEARKLSDIHFLADPPTVRFYQTIGDIYLDFHRKGTVADYHKELELSTGVAKAGYTRDGVRYGSESFISQRYNGLVYRVCTPDGEKFSFDLIYERVDSCPEDRPREYDGILGQRITVVSEGNTITLDGMAIDGPHPQFGRGGESVRFGGMVSVQTDGRVTAHDGILTVADAGEAVVYASFETDYDVNTFDFDRSKDYLSVIRQRLAAVCAADYQEVLEAHLRDHGGAFGTVELNLEGGKYDHLPTDQRLEGIRNGVTDDLDFYTLYFQYGRYLLLASSGGNAVLPAQLQGKWAGDFMPPWGADYHTNINLQMNYWIANVGHMHHVVKPLAHFMKMLSKFGQKTARKLYNTDGWVIHHTTDIYGRTGIHDSSHCGFFPMAGPWMCMNLWEQYEYTGDREYLKNTLYPILKGACRFLQGYLVEDRQGRLVTNPSNSPENRFYFINSKGEKQSSMFTYGATIDFEIIYAVFNRLIYASRVLGVDEEFASELERILTRIPKLQVGERYGTIREWIEDFEEVEPQHRHISHLFGLHPSDQINESDPVIFEAAKRTIARRLAHGGGQTGWSRAWIINFYARLLDGENAAEHLRQLLRQSTVDNLFDMHPPFQIDGNFGGSAGVAEMLLQSHLGTFDERIISVLPAVPAAWRSGSFKGLCARSNFYLDAAWEDGKVTKVTVHAPAGGVCRIKLTEEMKNFRTHGAYALDGNVLIMETVPGGEYEIQFP